MGMTITFKYVDMSKGSQNFATEGLDAMWGEIVPTDSNKKSMLFTKSYISDSQMIVVKQSSKIKGVGALNGKTVGAVSGSYAEKALLADKDLNIENNAPVKYNELISAFMDLDSGEVDALAVDETYALNRMKQHPQEYRFLDGTLSSEKYAVAVRRNDSRLRDAFQKALDSMQADGTSATISKKWFDKDLTAINVS